MRAGLRTQNAERGEHSHPLECTVWLWGFAFPLHHPRLSTNSLVSLAVHLEVWTEDAAEMVLELPLSLSSTLISQLQAAPF